MCNWVCDHCAGEDPLVDDQTDQDINSVAGVLKLYFRGLENPLFPKERFLDFISTTSELISRGLFNFGICSLSSSTAHKKKKNRSTISTTFLIVLTIFHVAGVFVGTDEASKKRLDSTRAKEMSVSEPFDSPSQSPGVCWNPCAHRSSTHSQSSVIHVAAQWKWENEQIERSYSQRGSIFSLSLAFWSERFVHFVSGAALSDWFVSSLV